MSKKLLLLLFFCVSFAKAQNREFEVRFKTDSYQLSPSQFQKLGAFIQSLPADKEMYTVAITGHTDAVGDLAYNAVLSDRRAEAIARIFKNKGFAEEKVLTSGQGEIHPAASNDTDSGKAQNRRAVIKVFAAPAKAEGIGGF